MPVYEFTCNVCGAPVSVFVRSISSGVAGKCERCGSADLRRLVSKFAVIKSGGGFDSFDESMLDNIDENDPRAMAAFARQMQREMGDELGSEFDEVIDRMERGEPVDDLGFGDDGHDHDDGGFADDL